MSKIYETIKVHPGVRTLIRKIGAQTNENMIQVLRRLLEQEAEKLKIK